MDCFKIVDHPKATKSSSIVQNSCETHQQQQQPSAPSYEERRQYDPTPLQYQQQQTTLATNTFSATSTIEDFEENLFNSLMYSVDESTEREILNNLNISDELLASYSLVAENSSIDDQNLNPSDITEDQSSFSEKFFEQIQRRKSYEQKPEYKETRDNLEKELLQFREINLHEPQHQLEDSNISTDTDIMKISSNNPKYINHAKLDDHLLYK